MGFIKAQICLKRLIEKINDLVDAEKTLKAFKLQIYNGNLELA